MLKRVAAIFLASSIISIPLKGGAETIPAYKPVIKTNESGTLSTQSGWIQKEGNWYYFNSDGTVKKVGYKKEVHGIIYKRMVLCK